jgi:hydroxypyruvate isomerase
LPHVGEIEVADVPGRCEPGTGEINSPLSPRALNCFDYTGVVALEGCGSGAEEVGDWLPSARLSVGQRLPGLVVLH